jgi:NlpC/P60 family
MKPPPDYPPVPDPLLLDGSLTPAATENAVVSIASRYLGVPYKWGGARPKTGFDCSGLVQYVFAQLGVSLPHYAAGQWYSPDAVWIPPYRLQPGDLVFFTGPDGTPAAPGHVGIYVGDGYLIDAPHTGAFVRVDSLDERWFANKYVGAKRIVGASLDARRLLRAGKDTTFISAVPLIHRQLADQALADSPPLVAAIPTTAHASAPGGYEWWTGVVVSGILLLLVAGAVSYRRRRRTPETDPPS